MAGKPLTQGVDICHHLLHRGNRFPRRQHGARLDQLSGKDVFHTEEIDPGMIGCESARR
jgi:hypothetical protein